MGEVCGAPTDFTHSFSQFIILKRCEQKSGGTSHCEKEGGKLWVHLIWSRRGQSLWARLIGKGEGAKSVGISHCVNEERKSVGASLWEKEWGVYVVL